MKTSLTAVALTVLIALGSFGCVSQRQYDELELAYRKSQEQVAELQARIDELNQRIKLLEADPQEQAKRIQELMAERDQLIKQLDELRKQYEVLAARGPGIALPADLDAALKELAAQHPDILEYDPATGLIKFKSDVTFSLGSADLTANAKSVVNQLAGILNSPIASKYEARVVGHTDSVRIARPETAAKHPTNWHLSVHRAISVRDALESGGVSPVRTSVGGYSMYRPAVQNAANGAAQNRRVEIYLVPMAQINESMLPKGSDRAPAAAPRSAPKAAPKAAPKKDEIPLK